MSDDQWKRVGVLRTDVNEVNVHPIDVRPELWQGIQPGFRLTPVVQVSPVADQLLQPIQLRALRPIGDGFLVRPSRRCDPAAKIDELLFRNLHFERMNRLILFLALGRYGVQREAYDNSDE